MEWNGNRNKFDCTPQQYHAGLDILWKVLGLNGVQDKDVYTLITEEIERLRDELEDIQLWGR